MAHRADGLNDIFEHNVTVRENVHTDGGTIQQVPIENKDIVNKEYVDQSVVGGLVLYLTENASDIATYFDLKPTPTGDAEEDTTTNIPGSSGGTLMASFSSVLNCECVSALEVIPAGSFPVNLHASAGTTGRLKFYAEIYKRTAGGVETLLTTTDSSDILTDSEEHYTVYASTNVETPWISTDRIVLKLYGLNTTPVATNLTFYVEGTTASRLELTGNVPAGFNVTAGSALTTDKIVIGNGGTRGVESSSVSIDDSGNMDLGTAKLDCGQLEVDSITINNDDILSSSGDIGFGAADLTTSGNIQAETAVITGDGNLIVLEIGSETRTTNVANTLTARGANELRASTIYRNKDSGGTNRGGAIGSDGALGGGLMLSASTTIGTANLFIDPSGDSGDPEVIIADGTVLRSKETYDDTSANAANVYINSAGRFFRATSSEKWKENITDIDTDTSKIYNLRPVNFDSTTDADNGKNFIGLIAEEVLEEFPEGVQLDKEGNPDGIQWDKITVAMLTEMKKLKERIEELEK